MLPRRPSPLWLGLLACCHSAPAVHPVVDAPCDPDRIGNVTIAGAKPSDVPNLAVLAGTYDDPERLQRFADVAADTLAMRGYPHASLRIARRPGCFVDLAVTVELGQKYRIARIDFDTDDDFPNRERLATLEDGLGTVNVVGGVLIPYRLERGIAALQRRYRDAGWLDAVVQPAVTSFGDDGKISVVIPVRAGTRARVATVRATSKDPAARKAILAELRDHAGTWYDGPAIRNAIARVRRKLARPIDVRTQVEDGEVVIEAIAAPGDEP